MVVPGIKMVLGYQSFWHYALQQVAGIVNRLRDGSFYADSYHSFCLR